jgi:hypothetical protein
MLRRTHRNQRNVGYGSGGLGAWGGHAGEHQGEWEWPKKEILKQVLECNNTVHNQTQTRKTRKTRKNDPKSRKKQEMM